MVLSQVPQQQYFMQQIQRLSTIACSAMYLLNRATGCFWRRWAKSHFSILGCVLAKVLVLLWLQGSSKPQRFAIVEWQHLNKLVSQVPQNEHKKARSFPGFFVAISV
jgi:hypothetical protein